MKSAFYSLGNFSNAKIVGNYIRKRYKDIYLKECFKRKKSKKVVDIRLSFCYTNPSQQQVVRKVQIKETKLKQFENKTEKNVDKHRKM